MPVHEIVSCERCGAAFECKAGSPQQCDCQLVRLDLNELQYVSEKFAGCICLHCLQAVKAEYKKEAGLY